MPEFEEEEELLEEEEEGQAAAEPDGYGFGRGGKPSADCQSVRLHAGINRAAQCRQLFTL